MRDALADAPHLSAVLGDALHVHALDFRARVGAQAVLGDRRDSTRMPGVSVPLKFKPSATSMPSMSMPLMLRPALPLMLSVPMMLKLAKSWMSVVSMPFMFNPALMPAMMPSSSRLLEASHSPTPSLHQIPVIAAATRALAAHGLDAVTEEKLLRLHRYDNEARRDGQLGLNSLRRPCDATRAA